MAVRVTRGFAVEGAGEFPIDMLRRDRCWPASAVDARSIATMPRDDDPQTHRVRYIRLETDTPDAPDRRRWAAMGWRVID